jgi:chromate reductase
MKIVSLCGSLRKDSWNKKALQIAEIIAKELGAEVFFFDLKENPLPLYDADLHPTDFPPAIAHFRELVLGADVILFASPEYNHSITGALKNAIDWLSVKINILDGKRAAIFGVSSGIYGTVRGQAHLRQILAALNVSIVPQPQVLISISHFDENGNLKQEVLEKLKVLIKKTITI